MSLRIPDEHALVAGGTEMNSVMAQAEIALWRAGYGWWPAVVLRVWQYERHWNPQFDLFDAMRCVRRLSSPGAQEKDRS